MCFLKEPLTLHKLPLAEPGAVEPLHELVALGQLLWLLRGLILQGATSCNVSSLSVTGLVLLVHLVILPGTEAQIRGIN